MKKLWIVSAMVAVGLLLGIHSTCLAVPYIEVLVQDIINNVTVTVQDGGVGDVNPQLGAVTFVGPVGAWTLNVTTGLTYPQGPSIAAVPFLDLLSVNATSDIGGSLAVAVNGIGYTGPIAGGKTGGFQFDVGGTLGGPTTGTIDLFALYDPSNLLFSDGGVFSVVGHLGTFSPNGAFSGSTFIGAFDGAANPYGLGIQANITHVGGGTTSFDSSLQGKVPEPISLILLGSGLAGAGLYRRLRKPKG